MITKNLGKATRDAYGQALVELGKRNPNVVVIDADLSKSTKTADFAKAFPERFFDIGIMEAHLAGLACGLAAAGKIPFFSSFATFLMSKGFDQLRMGAAFSELNVKAVGSHGGISVGEDGASQMSIEDFALAMSLPYFVVLNPADEFSTRELTYQMADIDRPCFMRTGRPKAPLIYNSSSSFTIGKGVRLRDGKDLSIIATGLLVAEALDAAQALQSKGISAAVVDIHTLKPLDEEMLIQEAKRTGRLIVAEEHQIWGGLGSAVARIVSQHAPSKMEFIAIQDTFAESGQPEELFEKYGLTSSHIVKAAEKLLN